MVPSTRVRAQQPASARPIWERAQGCPSCAEGKGTAGSAQRCCVLQRGQQTFQAPGIPGGGQSRGAPLPAPRHVCTEGLQQCVAGQHCPSAQGTPRCCKRHVGCAGGSAGVGPLLLQGSLCARSPMVGSPTSPQLLAPDRALQRWRAGQCQDTSSGLRAVSER